MQDEVKTKIFNTDSIHCWCALTVCRTCLQVLAIFRSTPNYVWSHTSCVSHTGISGCFIYVKMSGRRIAFSRVSLTFCWSPATFCDNQILPVHLQPEIGRQVCIAVDYKASSLKTVHMICKKTQSKSAAVCRLQDRGSGMALSFCIHDDPLVAPAACTQALISCSLPHSNQQQAAL